MSSEDVISKLRKKELQRDYKSLLDENRKKMPILLPITSQADIFELFSHPREFKETAFFFVEALRLSIHRTSLITLVAWKTSTVCFSRYQQSLFSRWLACSLKWQITVGCSASTDPGWSSSEHKRPWNFSSWITLKNTVNWILKCNISVCVNGNLWDDYYF